MADRIFLIGASFGGVQALTGLVRELPADFPAAILVVLHRNPQADGMLAALLGRAGPLPSTEAYDGQRIKAGHIYVAPPDRHLLVTEEGVRLSHGPRENHTRPAVDPLFRSAALTYGARVVATVLTGHLDDGTAGLLAVKDRGGTVVVQDPTEAMAPSMPRSALRHAQVDHCCALRDMPALFMRLAADPPDADSSPSPGLNSSAASQPLTARRLMDIETHIAAGMFDFEEWRELEAHSAVADINCPECRSALYQIGDSRLSRFRCRAGHGFGIQSLLQGQAHARETLCAALLGALTEELSVCRRLQALLQAAGGPQDGVEMAERTRLLEEDALAISRSLSDSSRWPIQMP